MLASAGFGMLTAPIMDLHNQKGYFLHHVIFACCTLICIICILLLPESRHQPLPESLSEGEGYTRHPLLPPHKKPAEQRHLLPDAHARSNAQRQDDVKGTPLHAVAVSTVESTASSTIVLDQPTDLDNDLNAVRLSVLKCSHSSLEPHSSAGTESLPDLILNATPPEPSQTPPHLYTESQSEFNSFIGSAEGPLDLIILSQITSSSTDLSNPLPLPPPSPASASLKPHPPLEQTGTDPAPLLAIDLTVSSPIDSAMDCPISNANGGASS